MSEYDFPSAAFDRWKTSDPDEGEEIEGCECTFAADGDMSYECNACLKVRIKAERRGNSWGMDEYRTEDQDRDDYFDEKYGG